MARISRAGVCLSDLLSKLLAQLLIRPLDDYNSWQESFWGRWKRRNLPKDVILAEGIFPLSMLISSLSGPKLTSPYQATKNTTCTVAP